MEVLDAHPELAPGFFQVLSGALTESQRRVQELEEQLAEAIALRDQSNQQSITTHPPENEGNSCASDRNSSPGTGSSDCSEQKLRKIAQIESESLELQFRKDNEIQAVRKSIILFALTRESAELNSVKSSLSDLRDEYDRERKIGSELRTALEERYISIRTQETDLEARRRAYDKDLEEHKPSIEALTAESSNDESALAELRQRFDAVEAEKTALEAASIRFQALTLHTSAAATQRQTLFKETLSISNGKVIAKQAEFDKLARESTTTIRALQQSLEDAQADASAAENERSKLTHELESARRLEFELDDDVRRERTISARLSEKLKQMETSAAVAADQARLSLEQEVSHFRAAEERWKDESRALRKDRDEGNRALRVAEAEIARLKQKILNNAREKMANWQQSVMSFPALLSRLNSAQDLTGYPTSKSNSIGMIVSKPGQGRAVPPHLSLPSSSTIQRRSPEMQNRTSRLSSSSDVSSGPLTSRLIAQQERALYLQFMRTFPVPAERPRFSILSPIASTSQDEQKTLYFSDLVVWCSDQRVHALLFGPTLVYDKALGQWKTSTRIRDLCGPEFDLFISQGSSVYYVGTYTLKCLRKVHRAGSTLPDDLSEDAMRRAAGIGAGTKVVFPSASGKILTECFGLQCVGFDSWLYAALQRRFQTGTNVDSSSTSGLKRKSSGPDLGEGRRKSLRLNPSPY
ncbi:hypothetical protein B0H11DRAFT_2122343 [Mycena galericulata]|nr:hypothetical protein B0H11DRAFT_2122343 [Mycena galericulata]